MVDIQYCPVCFADVVKRWNMQDDSPIMCCDECGWDETYHPVEYWNSLSLAEKENITGKEDFSWQ